MLLRRYHKAAPETEEAKPDLLAASEVVENKPAEAEAEAVTPWPDGQPTEKWRTAELEAYAEAHGIDLTGAGNKAEKLEAIRAHAAN